VLLLSIDTGSVIGKHWIGLRPFQGHNSRILAGA